MSLSAIPNLSQLVPINGVCYSPAPSDDAPAPPEKFFDTDFANSSFPLLWGTENQGRGDIENMAGIGVNFVHLYNWSVPPSTPNGTPGDYQRNHYPFLKECEDQNVKVLVPISNYFLGQINQGKGDAVKGQIKTMVNEVYNGGTTPLPAAGMWGVANEYDLATSFTAADVATAMEYILDAESSLGIAASDTLPICSPVSFAASGGLPPAIKALQNLQDAITSNSALSGVNFWDSRFVAGVNSFNDGSFLSDYISTTFPLYFQNTPFFLSEMGINTASFPETIADEQEQARFVTGQLQNTNASGYFLGRCVFQYLDQSAMKTGTEATFGMTTYDTAVTPDKGTIDPSSYVPGGGDSYNVDTLLMKPLYASVTNAYMPSQ